MVEADCQRSEFTHPTLLVNPKYEAQAGAVRARLNQAGYSVSLLHTEPDLPGTAEIVADHYAGLPVDPCYAPLLVIGGDGTVDLARRALVSANVQAHANGRVALSSVGGGFARDHRRDSHGVLPKDPAWVLKHSVVVPARWLEITIQNDSAPSLMEATLYAGIGKTAHGADLTTRKKPSDPKLKQALQIGLGAIFGSSTFEASINDGKPRELSDITMTTSGSMSMFARFPTVLWRDEIHVSTVRPGRFWTVVALARMATGFSDGHTITEPIAVDILSDTRIHHDGEPPTDLPAGSTLQARLSEDAYPLLTSRRGARMLNRALQALGQNTLEPA